MVVCNMRCNDASPQHVLDACYMLAAMVYRFIMECNWCAVAFKHWMLPAHESLQLCCAGMAFGDIESVLGLNVYGTKVRKTCVTFVTLAQAVPSHGQQPHRPSLP